MKVLFLTIGRMESIKSRSIYTDLLRQFRNSGHEVYIVSPREKRTGMKTELIEKDNMLYVQIGNITKCNIFEKGISTVLIEVQFKNAIRRYFRDVKFDLIIYSTPPVTLSGVVEYIKKRDGAKTYLLLKDIFPQNSLDLGILRKTGVKGLIYRYFLHKEKRLYALSDRIGCMSQANCDYILKHNLEISDKKVEVCPNSLEPIDMRISDEEKAEIRKKYDLPQDKKIFLYGGNLGRPQNVPFIVECLKVCSDIADAFFVVAGSGTDMHFLEEYVAIECPQHVKLLGFIPKQEYDRMIACCDVGMIFLDHRFTIPNFPSRLLTYMQAGLPVLACTDPNTDIGKVIVGGGFGWWCECSSSDAFRTLVNSSLTCDFKKMGNLAYDYLLNNYTSEISYKIIMKHLKE